ELSGRLENAINQELARSGISDKDVLQDSHREMSQWGLTWIESQRRIQADPQQVPDILNRLSAEAQKGGFRTLRRDLSPPLSVLELGKGPFLMQRLEFVPRAAT